MFGNNKKKTETGSNSGKHTSTPTNALNSLVKGTTIEGEIHSESDLRVDGTIKGNLVCKAKVIIGPTGLVEGEIQCANAIIEGKMDGTIRVSQLLTVKETADVSGEVYTNKLIVQSGAIFNVGCKMGTQHSNGQTGRQKPAAKEISNQKGRPQADAKKAS